MINREIKFRAWSPSSKFGASMIFTGLTPLQLMVDASESFELTDIVSDTDCVWMQYTGLKDKNGKDIYEGDIFKLIFCGEFEYLGKVEWGGLGWIERCIKDSETNMGGYWPLTMTECFKGCEVIGNIYENPELIK